MRWLPLVALCSACGDNISDDLYFTFDDRQLLCGAPIDDYINAVDWDRLQERVDIAVDQRWVLNIYAHTPGESITVDTLERAFAMFDRAGLRFTTYRDLDPNDTPYAGVVFAFDDDAVDAWFDTRALLDRYGATATLFVTYYESFSDEQRAKLHMLADEGYDVEAHALNHANAVDYSAEHGVEAYLQAEVLPSFQVLRDDGFAPESFAYPGGARTDETDRAIEPYVRYLRTTPGPCVH